MHLAGENIAAGRWTEDGGIAVQVHDLPPALAPRGAELASARVLRHVDRWHDERAGPTRIARITWSVDNRTEGFSASTTGSLPAEVLGRLK